MTSVTTGQAPQEVRSLDDAARRAAAAMSESITNGRVMYRLGKGGLHPESEWPWNEERELDCSGFAAWCWGMSRHFPDMPGEGAWIETTAIVADAEDDGEVFVKLNQPRVGCGVVWGDSGRGAARRQGHIGIVAEVSVDALGHPRVTAVIHCSSKNFHTTGNAIRITSPIMFARNGAIYVAPRRLAP